MIPTVRESPTLHPSKRNKAIQRVLGLTMAPYNVLIAEIHGGSHPARHATTIPANLPPNFE
jgi:hypothetical protein